MHPRNTLVAKNGSGVCCIATANPNVRKPLTQIRNKRWIALNYYQLAWWKAAVEQRVGNRSSARTHLEYI
jgi:hypothetical protein